MRGILAVKTGVVVHVNGAGTAPVLVADLESAGLAVLAVVSQRHKLVHEVVRHAPDVVVCDDPLPGESLFKTTQALAETAPCAVLVFTGDGDAERMAQALDAGIHAWVVNGYGAARLRPLVHLAQARFRREQAQRQALQDLSERFEERKAVDRAKGILMRARQLSDDDAFQILRTASMHTNQRLGQVSQHIIHSARFADAVNRAGQLRMLSQRLVLMYLLQLAGVQALAPRELLKDAVARIDGNLAALAKQLSAPTFGDLLTQVQAVWARLKPVLQGSPKPAQVGPLDEAAEALLRAADTLTTNLEQAGAVTPLHALNMAGRQRMLSQRFAKCALLGVLGSGAAELASRQGMAEAQAEFGQALQQLHEIPLSTPDIRAALAAAGAGWQQMQQGAQDAALADGRERLAEASEAMLARLEHLSGLYERSMQMLVG